MKFAVVSLAALVTVLVLSSNTRRSDAATCVSKTLRIGAFNIQSFGRTKMSNTVLADQIRKIVERYDVLLIQEIRDKSGQSVRDLKSKLGCQFDFVISNRIGRTRYKEQYAYFYRTDRVSVLGTFTYDDKDDVFEREPYVIKIKHKDAEHNMAVSLIGLHVRPSDAIAEIRHLREVLGSMGDNSEPFVLGDLNAACSYANVKARKEANDYLTVNSLYTWLIDEDADTTTRASTNCAYDRIIVRTSLMDRVVTNSAKVFNYSNCLGLTERQALKISDHFPVEMKLRFN